MMFLVLSPLIALAVIVGAIGLRGADGEQRAAAVAKVRAALLFAFILGMQGLASATGTACADLNATPTVAGSINCIIEAVAPFTVVAAILTAFIPIMLVMWGLRGTIGLVVRVVLSMFGLLKRAT